MGAFAPTMPVGTLNVALSNFMKSYRNNNMMFNILAPRVPVDRQSFQYVVFDRSNQRNDRQTLRAPGAIPQSVRMNYSVDPYFCKSHALRGDVPFESEQYALGLGFSEQMKLVQFLTDRLDLDTELNVASLVTNPANVTNTLALSGTSMWDNYTGVSHPIQVVEAAKSLIRQAGVVPNTFILSDPVVVALQSHPDIIERFKYTQPGAITMDQLSQVFGVQCYRASAIVLDKNNDASWIWGETAVLTYTQNVTSQSDLSALKTFDWTGAPGTVGGYGVLEFPDPNLDAKTNIASVDRYYDIRITGQETLFTFTGCVAAPTMGAIPAPVIG